MSRLGLPLFGIYGLKGVVQVDEIAPGGTPRRSLGKELYDAARALRRLNDDVQAGGFDGQSVGRAQRNKLLDEARQLCAVLQRSDW